MSAIERMLYDLHRRWKWNADLMDCRECGRSIHASRVTETLNHRAGCSNEGALNPWAVLFATLSTIATTQPEADHAD